jgi:hypothetical protein
VNARVVAPAPRLEKVEAAASVAISSSASTCRGEHSPLREASLDIPEWPMPLANL